MGRIALLLFCCATAALAQTERVKATPMPKSANVQNIEFGAGQVLEGGIQKPVGEYTVVPEKIVFKRMIQIRGSFANELHQSVEAIR